MSSAPPGRRRKQPEPEEHENHERWMVSYADMMTLLLVLFIVLYAMSQVDKAKFEELASGLSEGFGTPVAVNKGSSPENGVLDGGGAPVNINNAIGPKPDVDQEVLDQAAAEAALQRADRIAAEARAAYSDLDDARQQIQAALDAAGYSEAVRFEMDARGLVAHIVADQVLFDAEEAVLRPEGTAVLQAIAPTLAALPNELAVEGHANHLPVTVGGRWPSNWELSAYRSTTVVRYLAQIGVPQERLAANGYSSTRPLVAENDPNALSINRRVDVVVVSAASAEANALLPGLDAAPKAATQQEATP